MKTARKMLKVVQKSLATLKKDLEPDFEPDENMGEGTAPAEELLYRASLLFLLKGLYVIVSKEVQSPKTYEQKMSAIDKAIAQFETKSKDLITKQTSTIFNDSVLQANEKLKEFDKNIKKVKGNPQNLKAIQTQQMASLQDVSSFIRGRVALGLSMDEVALLYDTIPTYDYVDLAFNQAQRRMDGMGWYGHRESMKQGFLTAMIAGMVILAVSLGADWVTMGDDKVCEDCLDRAAESPHLLMEWPEDQHFGDRCWMANIRIIV